MTPATIPATQLCVDEWLTAHERNTAQFSRSNDPKKPPVKCTLVSWPHGNYVSADGFAATTGNAFLAAVAQIEKTIGVWRS